MAMSRIWAALAAALAVASAHAPDARACGGFFTESTTEVAAMSDIRVAFVASADRIDSYAQVGYTGNAGKFAWIYPVPAQPTVSEGPARLFDDLDELTRPMITVAVQGDEDDSGGGCGCGLASDAKLGGSNGGRQGTSPVRVWEKGQVGAFDYVVVTATGTAGLIDWLSTNGYGVPGHAEPVLSTYVGAESFFVAMKVSTGTVTADVSSTTVVKLSYAGTEVRYPLGLLALSSASRTRIELYMVSKTSGQELTPSAPFAAAQIDRTKLRAISATTHNYDVVYEELAYDGRTLVKEYSSMNWTPSRVGLQGTPGDTVLTRYRMIITPAGADRDLAFEKKAYEGVDQNFFLVWDERTTSVVAIPLFLLFGLGGLLRRFGRRRSR